MRIIVVSCVLVLCACASIAQQSQPALLIEPSAQSHDELVHVVSGALSVPTIMIADDALTRDAMLVIDRAPARDASGQQLSGRDVGRPEQFQLVSVGSRCELVHLKTQKHYVLTKVRCKPVG
jgi:hypothetical protein